MTVDEINQINMDVLYMLENEYDEEELAEANERIKLYTPEMRKYREEVTPEIEEIIKNGWILEPIKD